MDITLFKDLERLNQTGNFSRAAILKNTSQPSFSRRIKALEAWVGVRLVDRSSQPVTLTSEGVQMLEVGLQAVALIEQERTRLLAARAAPEQQVVTFGQQHSISWRFYSNWLRSFEDAFGPIHTRLRADDLPHCMRDLESGVVDFVIAYAAVGDEAKTGQSLVIGKERLVPVSKPDPVGRPMFDLQASDVVLPFLSFGEAAPISQHLAPVIRDNGLGARLTGVYENSIAGALLIRVREGAGVAWLPESLIQADLANTILVRAGSDALAVDLDIRLYFNTETTNAQTRTIWSFFQAGGPDAPHAVPVQG